MDEKFESKGRVCVTGASGFIASWLIKRLLLSGYRVIGTVRDPGNNEKLRHLWRLEGAKERLELVRADLMEEGSFDDAIMGCHGVFHIASPVLGQPSSDPKAEILIPAIEGTLNILSSCKKNPSLKRVILTSSSSTVRARDDFDLNVPLDESSWSSVELCERLQIWYALSKTLAERTAWEFCKDNKIDLVTVLPSFVVGPSLSPHLCTTASDVLGLLEGKTEKFHCHGRMGYVHIDDVALCHILAYEHENAHGRYLCSSIVVDNNELVSVLSRHYPTLPIPKRFEALDRPYYELNTSKLRSLGFKFKCIEEMFDDCIASLMAQGHLCLAYNMMLHTWVRSSSFGGFGFIDMETTTPWLPLLTPIPPPPPPWFPTFLSTDDEQPLIILKFLQHSLATEKWCIWKKPKVGWIKLNTDGSIRGGRNNVRITSYGGLLRDYNGLPICAYVSSVLPPKDVHNIFVVELWAIWRGLMHAFKLGIKYIWIESDSLSVVKTIKKEQQCFHSTANSGLDHIWRLLNKFDQFEISHSWRESNWAADYLAKMDFGVNDAVLQPVDFPESLIDIINEDARGKLYTRSKKD
ncbi:unnamed protein product [Camellia sinensis]